MVIQSNMTISGIVSIWPETEQVFTLHNISQSTDAELVELLSGDELTTLLAELNHAVASSAETCTDGG